MREIINFFYYKISISDFQKIIFLVSLLLFWGAIFVYSSSFFFSIRYFHNPYRFFFLHIIFLSFGYFLMLIISQIPYQKYKPWIGLLLLLSFILLILVLIPNIGTKVSGARRWIRLGFIGFQPTELLKISLIFWLADFLARKESKIGIFTYSLLPVLTVFSGFGLLVLFQPDFGSLVLLFSVLFFVCYLAGVRWIHLTSVFLVFSIVGFFLVLSNAYRVKRILGFLSPWENRLESGYQLVNSLIAYGGGGIFGRGLGNSLQKEYFLPQAHTDFIFAVLAEETGILGIFFTCFLYCSFALVGFRVALQTKDAFGKNLAFGIVGVILFQTLMNLFVVLGLAPTKGIGLPLMSYGGSSLLVFLVLIGVLLNISKQNHS